MDLLHEKLENLKKYLASLQKVAVAFSGGVDSVFLLKVAHDELGENAVAINAKSVLVPKSESNRTKDFCDRENIPLVQIEFDALAFEKIKKNPVDRCYFCKKEIFSQILQKASSMGIKNVLDGTNTDDLNDYRPGIKALKELKILSPLKDCGFSKSDIRSLSQEFGLSSWDLPSSACLASRIEYDEELTEEKLLRIDAAEDFLHSLGFSQCRVRLHKNLARIELEGEEIEKAVQLREQICSELKKQGFSHICLDLQGYHPRKSTFVII